MDEYLILLLFLGILFVLFFYRDDIFGKQQSQIIQPLRRRTDNKKHKKHKHNKYKNHKKHKTKIESESDQSSDSESSEEKCSYDEKSAESFSSKNSIKSNDTFPSIGSELSHGNNKGDDDTF